MTKKEITTYHYKDLKLISYNDIKFCIRTLPNTCLDFLVPNEKSNLNYSFFRFICENNRYIDIIEFPSLIEYNTKII